MKFEQYKIFDRTFAAEFGAFCRHYPFASALFEKELRNHLAGRTRVYSQNVEALATIRPEKIAYETIAPLMLSFKENRKSKKILLALPKFLQTEEALKNEFHKRGNIVEIGFTPNRGSWSDLFLGKNPHLGAIGVPSLELARAFRILKEEGPYFFLKDTKRLSRIDQAAKKGVNRISDFITRKNYQMIVAQGEAGPSERLLCEAAALSGVPYVVISHGYIQDPKLISIAPIRSAGLVVWSKKQQEELQNALQPDQAQRIFYFGYPKDIYLNGEIERKNVLFVMEPFCRLINYEECLAAVGRSIRGLQEKQFNVAVRPHPKDLRSCNMEYICRYLGIGHQELSRGSLGDELRGAAFVIGTNSSVLFEASALGIPTFQIDECCVSDFEGVQKIRSTEVLAKDFLTARSESRIDPLKDNVCDMIDCFLGY